MRSACLVLGQIQRSLRRFNCVRIDEAERLGIQGSELRPKGKTANMNLRRTAWPSDIVLRVMIVQAWEVFG